ncbi:MAG: App1 family protein [Ferruginibacter sp.]|nr:App1 family protein [Ferruginibacter sp.]
MVKTLKHPPATVKVYHGYGHKDNLILHGHVLAGKPVTRSRYTNNIIANIFHLVKLFFVKPLPNMHVSLQWNNQLLQAVTADDGFFKFEWKSDNEIDAGWHDVIVNLLDETGSVSTTGEGKMFVPHSTQYAFISDIDDTILVSYAASIFKRLQTLFTKNPHTRKTFADVVRHYGLLSMSHTTPSLPNPFFFVSSSEWNLYDDLKEFFKHNDLPKGAFLLSEIKRWKQLLMSGKTKHGGKLMRVARILDVFPKQQFILLGDNSQHDPEIYAAIANKYPEKIAAVYIRNIAFKNEQATKQTLATIKNKNTFTCLFAHTEEAIEYSKSIGLIDQADQTFPSSL